MSRGFGNNYSSLRLQRDILPINALELLKRLDAAEGRSELETAGALVAGFVDLLEDDVVIVLAELEIDASGMSGGVEVSDAVEVVHDRRDVPLKVPERQGAETASDDIS